MNSTDAMNLNALIQQKSLLIIQAQFQQAIGQQAEAARLFLEAAVLEEQLAEGFKRAGKTNDAAISFYSAASCYKMANHFPQALACADSALSLTPSHALAESVRDLYN